MMAEKKSNFAKILPWILVVGGIIGIICSLVLTYDQIKIWQNPSYQPACSLNPVVSCGSVIDSKQGDILSIPAPFFGLLVFPALLVVGVAIWAGVQFKRWFWLALETGALGGFAFALWLFLISVYRVRALCPFCLITDVVVYTTTWYVTLATIEQGFMRLPKQLEPVGQFMRRHHVDLLFLWFLIVLAFTLHHFWYYYGKHL